MSKSFIKKIAFVLVFTFFFQINSGVVLALNNSVSSEKSKMNFFTIKSNLTELLKYQYIYETNKNRAYIGKILNSLENNIENIEFYFNNTKMFIRLIDNESIIYEITEKSIIDALKSYFPKNKTVKRMSFIEMVAAWCSIIGLVIGVYTLKFDQPDGTIIVRTIEKREGTIVCKETWTVSIPNGVDENGQVIYKIGEETIEVSRKPYIEEKIISEEIIQSTDLPGSGHSGSYNGHDTNPTTGSPIYRF